MTGKYWDRAWSLVEGCTPVSEACDNCWLASMSHRFKKTSPIKEERFLTNKEGRFCGNIRTQPDRLELPLKTRKPTVFAIWSDLFHEAVPLEFIDRAYAVMWIAEQHIFLVLTKRPQRMAEYWADPETPERICREANAIKNGNYFFDAELVEWGQAFNNIYHGTTVENQQTADERIPHLLQVPGKRFLSIEPMLGPVDLSKWRETGYWCDNPRHGALCPEGILEGDDKQILCRYCENPVDIGYGLPIHQVVLGGENGHGARPLHPDWVQAVRDQCKAAGVPFFFKQWGKYKGPGDWKIPAGRLLAGREHDDLIWREG